MHRDKGWCLPRSPRATMTASEAATISSRLGTESCDSTLAMISMTLSARELR